jgi:D-alanyl-D-alanine endopeptidase (penicillin-binding protein 7)
MDKIKYLFLALIVVATGALGKTHVSKNIEPSIWVYNVTRDRVEYAYNSEQVRPIASITKIMTAMVALDYDKDLSKMLKLDNRVGSNLPKQSYNRWQLFQAMLVRSDNAAAETLARDYPGGRSAFIARMNAQALEWGMKNTRFEDPTGLGANNISSVDDVANMMEVSAGYWIIQEITTRKQVAVETQFKKRIRTVSLKNTNSPLLFEFDNIIVSKTGLTSRAGWCLGLVVEQRKQQFVIVVLGEPTKQQRIKTIQKIMYNHVIDNQLPELELTLHP